MLQKLCGRSLVKRLCIFSKINNVSIRKAAPILIRVREFRFSATENALSSPVLLKEKFNPYADELEKLKRRREFSPQIILLDTNESISSMTLLSAQKLSKQRNLKLVKVEDPKIRSKHSKDVYQLIGFKEYFEFFNQIQSKKKLENKQSIKGEKLLMINSKIELNDLKNKMKNIHKWLEKRYCVKVEIDKKPGGKIDIYEAFQKEAEEFNYRIYNFNDRGFVTRFYINPPKGPNITPTTTQEEEKDAQGEDEGKEKNKD